MGSDVGRQNYAHVGTGGQKETGADSGGVPGGLKPPLAPQNTSKPPLAHQMLQNALNKFSIYLLTLEMTLTIWYIKISIIVDNCMF